MAKFIYSMQNVLNIKERMETQAKTEYAQMLGALHDEENRMRSIVDTLNSYKAQAKALASGKLDIAKIRRCNEAIEITEDMEKLFHGSWSHMDAFDEDEWLEHLEESTEE